MATSQPSKVFRCIRALALHQHDRATDGDLLDLYVRQKDESAFEALVRRHGPMVLGVCRRILGNSHDAEDAFQATFLVLVRKAASIRPAGMVGNWLYGVAHRSALEARRSAAKRRAKEAQVAPRTETPDDTLADLQPLLDQELDRLPDKYRAVLVLCDLEGRTRKEAAQQLGLPEGTIASRQARARTILAKRLTRHGVTLSSGALATALAQEAASASAPLSLVFATVKAARAYAAGPATAAAAVSAPVAALTEGVMKTMLLSKSKIILGVSTLLIASTLALYGAGAFTTGQSKQGHTGDRTNQQVEAEKKGQEVREAERPMVRVRHPKRIEAVPRVRFTGRLGGRQDDSIEVVFAIDERSYLRYQRLLRQGKVKLPGSPLYVGLPDEDGFLHQGTLKLLDDRINPDNGTAQAYGSIPNPDRLLVPGMFVRVSLPFGPPQKVLAVPEEAVLTDQGMKYVFVVAEKDIVQRCNVSLGASEGDLRIIEKGVSADDWIVVDDFRKLMPGTHVNRRIVDDARQEPQPKEMQSNGRNPPTKSQPENARVRQLQKERLAALKEIAAEKQRIFKQIGGTSPNEMIGANSVVLRAELELCASDEARIGVLKKLVANAKELEDLADKKLKAGKCMPYELLTVKVHRLEAEIELERAKAKAAPKLR